MSDAETDENPARIDTPTVLDMRPLSNGQRVTLPNQVVYDDGDMMAVVELAGMIILVPTWWLGEPDTPYQRLVRRWES